ncbi:MAG: tetratricopeptide repeat protein [Planctomycetes bacterium]|nr:tetratricopeptide repeat protein [Planctomycetota bacterium]
MAPPRRAAISPPAPAADRGHWRRLLGLALPVVAACAAYGPGLGGEYVHDDLSAIVRHPALQAGDWWRAAFGERHTSLAGRPFACLSFTLTFALGLDAAWGQRLLNLLLHVGNALLLAAVTRRALRGPVLGSRFGEPRARRIATAVATLFAAHPLVADAVAYPTQRSMLLMAGAFLVAAWATLRSHGARRPRSWLALACLAVAIGMGCKEEFAAAPILIGLLPFAYLEPSFGSWRRWRGFHAALAATWLLLLGCVALAPANATVGWRGAIPVTAFESLLTQAPVVVHYARASLWPTSLLPVYDWPIVRSPGPSLLPGAAVVAGIVVTALLWRRRRWWAWLGTMFFLLLAPTSSVLPILTELVADRRAYLPLLALLVPAVIGMAALVDRLAPARWRAWLGGLLLAAVTIAAVAQAQAVAAPYSDNTRLWQRAYEGNRLDGDSLVASTILGNQARELRLQGRTDEAHVLLDRAARAAAMPVGARTNHGISLLERGRIDDGIAQLRRVLQHVPGEPLATRHLCLALVGSYPRRDGGAALDEARALAEAEGLLAALVRTQAADAEAFQLLGLVLGRQGKHEAASAAFRTAVGLSPDSAEANTNLTLSLLHLGRTADAVAALRAFAARRPHAPDVQVQFAQLLFETGDHAEARRVLQEVLQRSPTHAAGQALRARMGPGR